MNDCEDALPIILFVDDDPLALAAMRRAMHAHRNDYCGVYAPSASDAIEVARRGPIDAVVTDIMMPEMDGFQLMHSLQADPATRNVPVIAVTGSGESGLRARAIELGAADLLSKPVDNAELRARIDSVLRLRAFQNQIEQQNRMLSELLEKRTDELLMARLEMLWKLSIAAEIRDDATGRHVARVGCVSRAIANAMSLPGPFVEMVAVTAPLHDIGKIGIPDAILLKPGPLTEGERRVIETHCRIGARVLESSDGARRVYELVTGRRVPGEQSPLIEDTLAMARQVALYHHERWDGAGYPCGLAGADIPLCARIVAVADVFDALRSARPYKPPMPTADAVECMRQHSGTQFDPTVYAAFLRALPTLGATLAGLSDAPHTLYAEAA
jgi:response regulator RpfG family c-di-GMP phosphodiesterase